MAMKTVLLAFAFVLGIALHAEVPVHKWDFNNGLSGLKLLREETGIEIVEGVTGKALYIGGGYKNNMAGGASTTIDPETFTKPFTIDLWLKLDAKVDFKNFRDIFGNGGDRGPGFRLTYYYNQLRLISGDGKDARIAVVGTKIVIPKEEWFFISVTYSGSELKIYLNGKEVLKKDIVLTAGRKTFSFGSYRNGMAYPLKGALDNVRIYDKVLEQSDIVAIYEKEVIR